MILAPALVRLILDTAEADDDESWELACDLLDQADDAHARQAAWDGAMFAARLLARLRRDHPEVVDVDEALAEWALGLATGARP